MASTNKCEYCGSTITSEDQTCPNCGASNPLYVVDLPRRVTDPKTIAELQEYCAERGMPLLRMRFFIGQDFREPKAFGIYKESPNSFVVYKNKGDGSRSVRYRGPDEAYAVKQIFDKLIQECHNRGIYSDGKPAAQNMVSNSYRYSGYSGSNGYRGGSGLFGDGKLSIVKLIIIIIAVAFILRVFGLFFGGSILNNIFSGGSGSSYSYDYNSGNNGSWNSNNSWNDNGGGTSWWYSDDDDDSSSSWWNSDSDDSSSWWDSDSSSDYDSSWDSDWGNDWSDWDSGGSDWDSDW